MMTQTSSSSSSSSSRCRCCSLRSVAILVALVAVFVTVVSPILDYLIAPLDDETTPVVEQQQKQQEQPFDPSKTDILGYKDWDFTPRGESHPEVYLGLTYILKQSAPRWMVKLAEKYDPMTFTDGNEWKTMDDMKDTPKKEPDDNVVVDILDARKNATGTFAERGFALIDMGETPSARGDQNWRDPRVQKAFHKDLEPRLREFYPKATRIEFTYNVIRGGSQFGDQPAATEGTHLDYTQNDTARIAFHEKFPPFHGQLEAEHLLGRHDTDEDELGVLLGVWKPVMMTTPVCDHPLAIMDAGTFRPGDEIPFRLHINFGIVTFHNLNGAIHHNPDQKFYYYPFQKDSEVLVFTQYTKGRHFANPHGSFVNPNCPEDSDKRVSVEMRVAVYFPKQQQ